MGTERDKKGQFLPGSGGRPPGVRNKLHTDFIAALSKDFEKHGNGVIRIVRVERPAEYLKIIAGTLPKEFHNLSGSLEDLTDDEITETLEKIRKLKSGRRGNRKNRGGAGGGTTATRNPSEVRH